VLGDAAIRAGAVVAVGIGVLGLFTLLVAQRLEGQRRSELDRRLVKRYCNTLEQRYGHACRVKSWKQVVVVDTNGDTHETITLTVTPDCDFLDFFSFWQGPDAEDWPESARRKVRVKVHSPVRDGRGGTRHDFTLAWAERNRLCVTVHFGQPVPRGGEIEIEAVLDWPGKCAPLVRGDSPEEFVLAFDPPASRVEYTVVLPRHCAVRYDIVGVGAGWHDCALDRRDNKLGQAELTLVAHDPPVGRRVGMRLDLP
jgi:hypothetical protein